VNWSLTLTEQTIISTIQEILTCLVCIESYCDIIYCYLCTYTEFFGSLHAFEENNKTSLYCTYVGTRYLSDNRKKCVCSKYYHWMYQSNIKLDIIWYRGLFVFILIIEGKSVSHTLYFNLSVFRWGISMISWFFNIGYLHFTRK